MLYSFNRKTIFYKLLFFVGLVLSFLPTLYGQTYNFRSYGVRDGLGQSTINVTFQDARGYLWFGSDGGGLSRFDGTSFTTYTEKDGLTSNIVLSIAEDNKGSLWIGTNGNGVCKHNGKQIELVDDSLLNEQIIYDIIVDKKGNIWFGTYDNGVIYYNGNEFKKIGKEEGLTTEQVFNLEEGKDGGIWVATDGGGAFIIKEFKVTSVFTNPDLKTSSIFGLTCDQSGKIWLGTLTKGIYIYDKGQIRKFNKIPELIEDEEIWALFCDKQGAVWIGTESKGAYKVDADKITHYNSQNGLTSNTIYSIAQDIIGNVWLGTLSGGVNKFQGETFLHIGQESGVSNKIINSVIEDSEGNVWIGTMGAGIYQFNTTGLHHIISNKSLMASNVNVITESKDKTTIWIGTEENGVYKYTKKTAHIEDFKQTSGLIFKGVKSIIEDSNGDIWFASITQGICRYSNKEFKYYKQEAGLCSDIILTIYEASDNSIWFCGIDGGITRMDSKEQFKTFTADKFDGKYVWTITGDDDGGIWIGTIGSGLWLYKKDVFKQYTIAEGLTSNNIYTMAFDYNANLWLGSEKGIDKVIIDNNNIKEVKHYGYNEGFKGIEVSHSNSAIFPTKLGKVWFATKKGATLYNPEADVTNKIPPKTHLTSLRLFHQEVNWLTYTDKVSKWTNLPEDLVLPFNQNHLSFDFIGIHYTNPDEIKYQYRLKGVDDDWVPVVKIRTAVYPNLSPGEYTFMLKAVTGEGIWSDHITYFSFIISPPFYLTWWFLILVVAVTITIFYLIIKRRERRLRREKKILVNKVQQRTEALNQSTKKIKLQNEKLELAYKDITGNITYAKRIQDALLPPEKLQKEYLPNSFILYKPKDIVSGDFYWIEKKKNKIMFAAVDCTGHGVSGAMVSVIGFNGLNRTVNEFGLTQPAKILDKLNELVEETLRQNENEVKDGMDIALCTLDLEHGTLEYAGANNPIYLIRDNEVLVTKGDKQPIGSFENRTKFTHHNIEIKKDDKLYIFSDGYADQFGGPKGKKFMYKKFRNTLLEISSQPIHEQAELLDEIIEDWMSGHEQVDDICIIGARL